MGIQTLVSAKISFKFAINPGASIGLDAKVDLGFYTGTTLADYRHRQPIRSAM